MFYDIRQIILTIINKDYSF